MPKEEHPSKGRIVHYVLENGECLPSMVVRTFTAEDSESEDTIDLVGFGTKEVESSDGYLRNLDIQFHQDVKSEFDCIAAVGTWHWPERV